MKYRKGSWVLLLGSLTGEVAAQDPAFLPPAPPHLDAYVLPSLPPPPEPRTLWSFLGLSHDHLARCRARTCGTGLMAPCSAVSPAETAAAKIKADEASAGERRAAVRFLGSVDCHYYPEAEAGLVAALRADRIECVRLEAARALANGCCCSARTIEALNLVITGSDADGNPAESSARVKCAAFQALNRCLSRSMNLIPASLPEPHDVSPSTTGLDPVRFQFAESPAGTSVIEQARRSYAERLGTPVTSQPIATSNRTVAPLPEQGRGPVQKAPEPVVLPVPPARAPLTPIGEVP